MRHLVRTAATVIALALLASPAAAELRRVEIGITGLDWASCARAVSAAIRKLEGIESVEVSLEKGSVDIRLKADNQVTLPLLRRTIRSNGNETRAATIAGRGRIVDTDGKRILDLLNGATMEIEPGSDAAPGGEVEITGVSVERARDLERVKITGIK